MKITKLLMLIVAVIFLSCSEDEEQLPTSEGMVGKWSLKSLDYRGTTTTTVSGVSVAADFTGTGKNLAHTTTFNSNPNTVVGEGSYTIVLSTTVMGHTTTEETVFDKVVTDGTWNLNGRALTVSNGGEPQTATVVEQTPTTLKIRVDLNDTDTNVNTGASINVKLQATYSFTKQ